MKMSLSDQAFDIINKFLITIIVLVILYPLIYVISVSISDPAAVSQGKMWLWPVDVTFRGYELVFQYKEIWIGYRNTFFYTILGTLLHLTVLLPCAYALSRKEVMGRKYILWIILFTMLFN